MQLCILSILCVVWAFFGIAFLWDWNENWPFPVLGHCWVFQICWHIECGTFTASSFRIWNSSTGILSPPLALLVVKLPKAHLTSLSKMSSSRWVITSSWLSESWRSFLYNSSMYTWDGALTVHVGNSVVRTMEVIKIHGPPGTVHSPSSWSPGLLGTGKGTKCTPNQVCSCRVSENLSGLDLGSAQNSRPALDSAPVEHPLAWAV